MVIFGQYPAGTYVVNWQVTATTIYCEAVDDEVTLLVYREGTARCTGLSKYTDPSPETQNTVRDKTRVLKRRVACKGADCARAKDYRDRLLAEEGGKK